MVPERRHATGPALMQRLFNPFRYIAGGRALANGIAAIMLAGVVGALSNTHFDGVLDAHALAPSPTAVFVAEGIINWLSISVVLFVLGHIFSKTAFRAVDLFGTQAMARWPSAIVALCFLPPSFAVTAQYITWKVIGIGSPVQVHTGDFFVFGALSLVIIFATVWMVGLMYQSYSICCNVRGGKGIATFVAGVLVAEAVSKVAILRMLAA
jgi:hypothetical protein